jgi:hypothetical protein
MSNDNLKLRELPNLFIASVKDHQGEVRLVDWDASCLQARLLFDNVVLQIYQFNVALKQSQSNKTGVDAINISGLLV